MSISLHCSWKKMNCKIALLEKGALEMDELENGLLEKVSLEKDALEKMRKK